MGKISTQKRTADGNRQKKKLCVELALFFFLKFHYQTGILQMLRLT